LYNFQLQEGVDDNHFWQLAASRKYSAKEAYESLFLRSIDFEPFTRIWKHMGTSEVSILFMASSSQKVLDSRPTSLA
jgi:hypothetical protein